MPWHTGVLSSKEERQQGAVSMQAYIDYISSSRWGWLLAVLSVALTMFYLVRPPAYLPHPSCALTPSAQALSVVNTWWVSYWSDQSKVSRRHNPAGSPARPARARRTTAAARQTACSSTLAFVRRGAEVITPGPVAHGARAPRVRCADALLALMHGVSSYSRTQALWALSTKSSIALHTQLLVRALEMCGTQLMECAARRCQKSVMNAPLGFFDKTPVGRILARFSKDIDSVRTARCLRDGEMVADRACGRLTIYL
jgi:hypothetical protein